MSFDVSLVKPPCAHCGREGEAVFEFNLTHNVNKIVSVCVEGSRGKREGAPYQDWAWGRLDGWTAKDALPILEIAYARAVAPWREGEFRTMEPENGWGSLDDVRRCLAELIIACRENSNATIEVSG